MVLSVTGKGCKSSQVSDQELNESDRADEVSIIHVVQLKPECLNLRRDKCRSRPEGCRYNCWYRGRKNWSTGSYREQENSSKSCQPRNPSDKVTRIRVGMGLEDAEDVVVMLKMP